MKSLDFLESLESLDLMESLESLDLQEIWKTSLTDSVTTWIQEMLAHLKKSSQEMFNFENWFLCQFSSGDGAIWHLGQFDTQDHLTPTMQGGQFDT